MRAIGHSLIKIDRLVGTLLKVRIYYYIHTKYFPIEYLGLYQCMNCYVPINRPVCEHATVCKHASGYS